MKTLKLFSMIIFSYFFLNFNISYATDSKIYIATRYAYSDLDYIDCILKSRKTLEFLSFTINLDHDEETDDNGSGSAWGRRGGYVAVVRCLPNKSTVFFAVSGLNPKKVKKYANKLQHSFSQ